MMSDRKRKALIDLLEDPDERIYLVIKQVIKSEGQHILPMLTQVINNEESIPLQSQRAQEILYAILELERFKR
jgi:succinate dehydrogenase flavin-adding protein (antitoxin of CptAB toxin-antitoxin module)